VANDDKELADRDPRSPLLRYECLAVNPEHQRDPADELGTPYIARVDFASSASSGVSTRPSAARTHSAATQALAPSPACAGPALRSRLHRGHAGSAQGLGGALIGPTEPTQSCPWMPTSSAEPEQVAAAVAAAVAAHGSVPARAQPRPTSSGWPPGAAGSASTA
jgi:hypothetical protein